MTFSAILQGSKPSEVLRAYLRAHPECDKIDLGLRFTDEFPAAGSTAHQIIWGWRGPLSKTGFDDDVLDEELTILLQDGGYL
jgi:hypothetical protein